MAQSAELQLVVSLQDQATPKVKGLVGALGDIGKVAGGMLLGGVLTKGFDALSGALAGGMEDARATAQVMAQTQAVITSTGGAAGVSAQQIADMATSLSDASGKSLFGDDQIIAGQNMLLTFTGIKDQLPNATQAMLDMAQATGGDMQSAALLVGKALNSPAQGLSALTRVGVSFTDAQREQITAMQEAGNTAGAQQVILSELNKEFGGSAAAAAAATGGWSTVKGALGEAFETVATALLPALTALAGVLVTSVIPGVTAFAAGFSTVLAAVQPVLGLIGDNIMPILAGLAAALLTAVVPAFVAWAAAAGTAAAATIAALLPVVAPIAAIGAAAALLATAWTNDWGGIQEKTAAVLSFIQAAVQPAIDALSRFWTEVQPAMTAAWENIQGIVTAAWGAIQGVITSVAGAILGFITAHMATIQQIIGGAWTAIQGVIQIAWSLISGIITAGLAVLSGDWSGAWTAMQNTLSGVWAGIQQVVSGGLAALQGAMSLAWAAIQGAVSSAWEGIKAAVSAGVAALPGIISAIAGQMAAAGRAIIEGVISGVSAGIGALKDAVTNAARAALDAAKNFLGIHSPSKVMAEQVGKPMMDGIADGITKNAAPVKAALLRNLGSIDIFKPVGEKMRNLGRAAAQSLADGIDEQKEPVKAAVLRNLGSIDIFNTTGEKMRNLGRAAATGIAEGVGEGMPDVKNRVLGNLGDPAYLASLRDAGAAAGGAFVDEMKKRVDAYVPKLGGGGGGNGNPFGQGDPTSGGMRRALGGSVYGGQTYLVGERGPELFTARSSGTIIPNNQLGTINVTFEAGAIVQQPGQDARELAAYVLDEMDRRNRLARSR